MLLVDAEVEMIELNDLKSENVDFDVSVVPTVVLDELKFNMLLFCSEDIEKVS